MKKLLKNEKGLTLVEILTVLVIGAIFMLFITNFHLLIQNQYNEQSENVGGLSDVTIAAKEITKEIRKNPLNISVENDNTIIFNKNKPEEIIYHLDGDTLQKNGHDYVYDISKFEVSLVDSGKKITVLIESNANPNKNVDTEIFIR